MTGKRFAVGLLIGVGLFVGAAAVRAADDTVILKRVKDDTAVQNLVWDGREVETLDARYRGWRGYAGGYRGFYGYGGGYYRPYRGYYGYGYYPRYYYPRFAVGFSAYPTYYDTYPTYAAPSVYYYSPPTYYIPISTSPTQVFQLNIRPATETGTGPEQAPPPRADKVGPPPEVAPPPRPEPAPKPKPTTDPKDEGKLVKYKPQPTFVYRAYDEKPAEDRTIVIKTEDAKKR